MRFLKLRVLLQHPLVPSWRSASQQLLFSMGGGSSQIDEREASYSSGGIIAEIDTIPLRALFERRNSLSLNATAIY